MSKIEARLAKLVGVPRSILITRALACEPTLRGYVLGVGPRLVLLHLFHDFYPEGYVVARLVDVTSVRSGRHERFFDRMLRGEGLMGRVGIAHELPLDSVRSLLLALQATGRNVIIDCQGRESADEDVFYLGRILDVGEGSISILPFDALGRWDEEPSDLDYDRITTVQFDTPYINTITKYVKPMPSERGSRPA